VAYFDALEEFGTRVGEDDTFLILHHFTKKTRRTPKSEIDKAKKELEDYRRRHGEK
jgi:phage-related protein